MFPEDLIQTIPNDVLRHMANLPEGVVRFDAWKEIKRRVRSQIARLLCVGNLNAITQAAVDELRFATDRFGPMRGTHEGYAVIKEEVDELWDAVKANDTEAARMEAIQVAAMALRFAIDLGTKKMMLPASHAPLRGAAAQQAGGIDCCVGESNHKSAA